MSEDEQAPVYYNLTPWLSYGFYTAEDVDDIVAYSSFPGKPEVLRKALLQGFAMKDEEAKEWPEVTDCDRLDAAFAQLNNAGIIALHYAGWDNSDGIEEVDEERERRPDARGYCFYHEQNIDAALDDMCFHLSFGALPRGDSDAAREVGEQVVEALKMHGLRVEWDGSSETKIKLTRFVWLRRGPPEGYRAF